MARKLNNDQWQLKEKDRGVVVNCFMEPKQGFKLRYICNNHRLIVWLTWVLSLKFKKSWNIYQWATSNLIPKTLKTQRSCWRTWERTGLDRFVRNLLNWNGIARVSWRWKSIELMLFRQKYCKLFINTFSIILEHKLCWHVCLKDVVWNHFSDNVPSFRMTISSVKSNAWDSIRF